MTLKHLAVALLALTLFSCSKDGDTEEEPTDTTVNFHNKLDRSFDNAVIGSWKGGAKATVIKKLGTFAAGQSTGEIKITDPTFIKVYFYYDEGDKTYMTPLGYSISQGTFNNWNLDGNMVLESIEKTDEYYPE
ncbi:MAG: hypothetical protein JNK79_06430 [Chitinophagaceae bacterium]|nr:hypothetical protein [Chitinophagaceae bacterium]